MFPSATHEQVLGHTARPLRDHRQHFLAPVCGDAPPLWHRCETQGEQLKDPPGNILLAQRLHHTFRAAQTPYGFYCPFTR